MFKIEFTVFHDDKGVYKTTIESSEMSMCWNNLVRSFMSEISFFEQLQAADDQQVDEKEEK